MVLKMELTVCAMCDCRTEYQTIRLEFLNSIYSLDSEIMILSNDKLLHLLLYAKLYSFEINREIIKVTIKSPLLLSAKICVEIILLLS